MRRLVQGLSLLAVVIGLLAQPLSAGPGDAGQVRTPQQAVALLPADTLKRLQIRPDQVMEDIGVLIAGHGGPRGINRTAITRFIAVERAGFRAGQMSRLLQADLDNDGTVTKDEVAQVSGLLSARSRGLLVRAFARADRDGDGTVDMAEQRDAAARAARASFTEGYAALLYSLLFCDLDGDAAVTTEEVARVVAVIVQSTAQTATRKTDI